MSRREYVNIHRVDAWTRLFRRLVATAMLYPALFLALSPLLQATTVEAQSVPTAGGLAQVTTTEVAISAPIDPNAIQGGTELAQINLAAQMLAADMSGIRRLKVNAIDKSQFESYLKIESYAKVRQNDPKAAGIIDTEGNVDETKLGESYRQQIGLDRLSKYSRRLIRSILNEVTPEVIKGAGHEYANVFRITKDHRTEGNRDSEESVPPFDEEPRESQHFKNNGKAVDVSELDYLRGTKFTIETTVDAKTGKPVIKDGKPVEEVIDYEHLPLEPIQFVWQDEKAADKFPGTLPKIYGATPHNSAKTLAGNHLSGVLNEELGKHSDREIDFDGVDLSTVSNLGDLSRTLGQSVVDQAMGRAGVKLGPNAPLWTGQTALSQATGGIIPSFGFYGDNLDGAPNGETGMLINVGREYVGQQLGLPQGALIGTTSDEIFTNVGERTFEIALDDLPLGTLDGIAQGDRRSLEIHVGRGVLAKHLDLFLSQLPLGADSASFNQALGFQLDALATAPLAYDSSFGIRGTNATQQLVGGQLAPDSYLQQLGAAKLKVLEVYGTDTDKHRADSALNLDERPNLFTGLKNLPASPDPFTSTKDALDGGRVTLTDAESSAANARAGFVLDRFAFSTPNRQLLESVRNGNRSSDIRFVLSTNEFEAWLLETAYAKGYNADQSPKVSRFLSGDTGVFYEVGTDQVAKGVVKENEQRTALRTYFRTGVMPTLEDKATPVVDLNNIVGPLGLRSRADFEAIFRADAPLPVFEMIGRRILLGVFGQNPVDLAHQVTSPIGSVPELTTRLETLQTATGQLAAVSSGEAQQALQQASTVISQLQSSLETSVVSGKQATPHAWLSSLLNLYQVGQTAAGTADQHIPEYRRYVSAVSNLINGETNESLFTLGDNLLFSHPVGQSGAASIIGALNGSVTPNSAIRSFGNSVISQVNGLDPNTSQLAFDLLGAATSQRQTTLTDIRSQLGTFANQHAEELAEAASELELQTYGFDINGAPLILSDSPAARQTQLAEAMVRLITQGAGGSTGMRLGTGVIDDAFGIDGYQVSEQGYGTWGMLSTDIDGAIGQVMQRAQNDQKVLELLTGQTNADLTLGEQGNLYQAALGRWAAGVMGFPGNPRMLTDPTYQPSMDELIEAIEYGTGFPIDQVTADLPIIGDFVADRDTLQSFFTSDYWNNQAYLSRLEEIAGNAGLPTTIVQGFLNTGLTGEQREALIGDAFQEAIQTRVTPEAINEFFNLEGSDFALGGEAISGALGILVGDGTDKNGALQSLGAQIGDNYLAANFGFPVSWLWNDATSSSDKIGQGLEMLTQATNLDPVLGGLASSGFRTFFMGDGLDTSTIQGRHDLSQFVDSIGAAAGIPDEFRVLAGQGIQGGIDMQLALSGAQSYLDNFLIPSNVTDLNLGDMYQGFVGLFPETESLAATTAWNQVIGDQDLGAIPQADRTIEVINPNTGETVLVNDSLAGALESQTSKLREAAQTNARSNIQYAVGDALINQAFSGDIGGFNARGIARAMFEGTPDQKAAAFGGVLRQVAGSENVDRIIGGVEAGRDLAAFFSSPSGTVPSAASLAQLDSWFSSVTGVDAPAGSMSAMLSFARDGSTAGFSELVSPSSLVSNFSGFIDQSIGLPGGTTQFAYEAFSTLSSAQAAVDTATQSLFNVSGGADALEVLSAQNTLATAQTQLSLTAAGLVSAGVNLAFGKQIAAIDSALGLPSGTASLLVTTAITAVMVPGIALATLASTILLPGIGFLVLGALFSGGGLGSLFGGGTKKIKRNETLWSYHLSDPTLRSIADSHGDPKDIEGISLKPKEELDRADWPEEAWFIKAEDPGDSALEPNVIAPGKNIALKTDKQLPVGIFRGNTKQQFRIGSVGAAKTKINELLDDLLTLNTRLYQVDSKGERVVNDTSYIPNEIWTHNRLDVQAHEGLINTVYGQGPIGSYPEWIKSNRRGVGFDEKISLLVRWVHWQY